MTHQADVLNFAIPFEDRHGGTVVATRWPHRVEEMHAIVRQPGHRRRLDYVFTGSWHAHPEARAEVIEARLVFDQPVGGTWASDHFGLLVDLDITGGPN